MYSVDGAKSHRDKDGMISHESFVVPVVKSLHSALAAFSSPVLSVNP